VAYGYCEALIKPSVKPTTHPMIWPTIWPIIGGGGFGNRINAIGVKMETVYRREKKEKPEEDVAQTGCVVQKAI